MRMRAQRESQFRAAATAHTAVSASLAASVGTWTNLGPRPIVDNPTVPDGYGLTAGRVTAIAVDQSDPTGNTVLAAGAYGGVWRSTNAAVSDPTLVQWTPLIDDQPTLAVGAIALQPGNSNVVLVGTGEPNYGFDSYFGLGILRSTDGGKSWNTISTASTPSYTYSLYGSGVSQFAFSVKNPSTVVAATSFATFYPAAANVSDIAGTLLSTDAGATWNVVPFTNDNSKFYAASASSVVYNPKEDKFYAVLPFFGVYVSQGTSSTGFTSFIRLKNQPGKAGVLSTTACPASFSASCPLLRGTMTVRPVINTNDPDQMFVWFVSDGNGDSKDDQGIWKSSTDSSGTVTWTSVSDSGITSCGDSYGCGTTQSFYNLYLNAVPNGANTDLYAGTINIYKCSISSANPTCSTTPFKNLTHVYGCSSVAQVHPDQHAMDFLQSNPAIVYFGNDGGVTRSLKAQTNLSTGSCTAGANAFDNLNAHIGPLTQFMWGSNHPTDPNTLMGGSQDNGTMATSPSSPAPGDQAWWQINGGDGGYNWIDPVTPANWYSAYTGVSVQYCTSGINCNTNIFAPIIEEDLGNGTTHQVNGDDSNFYAPYILDPARPTQILVGTCRVWRGGNSAASWPNSSNQNALSHKLGTTSDLSCGPSDDPIQSLAAGGPSGANGSNVIYAGTSGGHVYVTTTADTGVATWTDVTGPINPGNFPISGVVVDWSDSTGMTAWATVQGFTNSGNGHVWFTQNGGLSWVDYYPNIPDVPVNDIVIDPVVPQTLYIATDAGVFVSSSSTGGYWSEIGPASGAGYLPNVAVLHLAIYKQVGDERLRAFTHGRGVWETGIAMPDLTAAPARMQLRASVGASVTQTTNITNNTTHTITFGNPSIIDDSQNEFSLAPTVTTCGSALTSGSTCALGVSFTPTGNASFFAGVSLPTSSAAFNPFIVYMNGYGIVPATDFSLNFNTAYSNSGTKAGGTAPYGFFAVDGLPSDNSTFSPPVNLSCSGLPSKSACVFSSSSLSQPGNVELNITTTAATSAANFPPLGGPGPSTLALVLFLPGMFFFASMPSRKRHAGILVVALTGAMLLGMAACGGGAASSPTPTPTPTPTPVPGTPAGTYNVVVTGTMGSITHSYTVILTVQ
jgi:hypothetical protein